MQEYVLEENGMDRAQLLFGLACLAATLRKCCPLSVHVAGCVKTHRIWNFSTIQSELETFRIPAKASIKCERKYFRIPQNTAAARSGLPESSFTLVAVLRVWKRQKLNKLLYICVNKLLYICEAKRFFGEQPFNFKVRGYGVLFELGKQFSPESAFSLCISTQLIKLFVQNLIL